MNRLLELPWHLLRTSHELWVGFVVVTGAVGAVAFAISLGLLASQLWP